MKEEEAFQGPRWPAPQPSSGPAGEADTSTPLLSDSRLATLFAEHSRRVLNAAYRVTGSRQDAEDVLQTVFLRLARRVGEVELTETVGSYLHRAAVNASIDLMRSRARAGSIPLDDLAVELPERAEPGADRRLSDGEFRRDLRAALLELPERTAKLFVLRYFEGIGNRELAEMMNMSPTAVAVVLHRTRKRLRSTLAPTLGRAKGKGSAS